MQFLKKLSRVSIYLAFVIPTTGVQCNYPMYRFIYNSIDMHMCWKRYRSVTQVVLRYRFQILQLILPTYMDAWMETIRHCLEYRTEAQKHRSSQGHDRGFQDTEDRIMHSMVMSVL